MSFSDDPASPQLGVQKVGRNSGCRQVGHLIEDVGAVAVAVGVPVPVPSVFAFGELPPQAPQSMASETQTASEARGERRDTQGP